MLVERQRGVAGYGLRLIGRRDICPSLFMCGGCAHREATRVRSALSHTPARGSVQKVTQPSHALKPVGVAE